MNDKIKISKNFLVSDWINLRSKLFESEDNWPKALEVFEERINSRFIEPIEMIKKNGKNEGEGFTIALISVVLLEFLAAFELGKIYKTNKEGISPHEYYSGIKLLKSFLSNSADFSPQFDSNNKIQKFYENIRCGLVHEARTMRNDVIISNDSVKNTRRELFYFAENGENRLNRDLFLEKIKEHISNYKVRILEFNSHLRNRFILKMDEISGLKHVWYFIYGSNLCEKQLNHRLNNLNDKYLSKHICLLNDYQFTYNKLSVDGSSKGNLVKKPNSTVQGIAILLLESTLDTFILNYEQGYIKKELIVSFENAEIIDSKLNFKAYTCISENTTFNAPAKEYVSKIVNGARANNLNEEYILNNLIYVN
jgi:hypothetical protein